MKKKDLEAAHTKMALMATLNQDTLLESVQGITMGSDEAKKVAETVLGMLQNSNCFPSMIMDITDPDAKDPKNRPFEHLHKEVWEELRVAAELAIDPNSTPYQMYATTTAALNRLRTFIHMTTAMSVAMTLSSMVAFKENLGEDSDEFMNVLEKAKIDDEATVIKVDDWIKAKTAREQN